MIDGGGRYNPNRYVILTGCSFAEVVRRLMINLNITEPQAEKLAGDCGYQKGEHYDISTAATIEKGEHYDTERVNIGTQKGEHYAETVNTSSPEQEVNINLEPQGIELQLSSSCPIPAATPPAIEEKEMMLPPPILDLDQRLLDAFAKLVGVYGGSSEQTKVELAGGLRVILGHHRDVQPSHFRHFNEYHQEQNSNRKVGPRYALPTVKYVVNGWEHFKTW